MSCTRLANAPTQRQCTKRQVPTPASHMSYGAVTAGVLLRFSPLFSFFLLLGWNVVNWTYLCCDCRVASPPSLSSAFCFWLQCTYLFCGCEDPICDRLLFLCSSCTYLCVTSGSCCRVSSSVAVCFILTVSVCFILTVSVCFILTSGAVSPLAYGLVGCGPGLMGLSQVS